MLADKVTSHHTLDNHSCMQLNPTVAVYHIRSALIVDLTAQRTVLLGRALTLDRLLSRRATRLQTFKVT